MKKKFLSLLALMVCLLFISSCTSAGARSAANDMKIITENNASSGASENETANSVELDELETTVTSSRSTSSGSTSVTAPSVTKATEAEEPVYETENPATAAPTSPKPTTVTSKTKAPTKTTARKTTTTKTTQPTGYQEEEIIWSDGSGAQATFRYRELGLSKTFSEPVYFSDRFIKEAHTQSDIGSMNGSVGTSYIFHNISFQYAEELFEQPFLKNTKLEEYALNGQSKTHMSYGKLEIDHPDSADYVDNHTLYQLVVNKGEYSSGIGPIDREDISVYKSKINGLTAVLYTTNYGEKSCAWIYHENLNYRVIIYEYNVEKMKSIVDAFVVS